MKTIKITIQIFNFVDVIQNDVFHKSVYHIHGYKTLIQMMQTRVNNREKYMYFNAYFTRMPIFIAVINFIWLVRSYENLKKYFNPNSIVKYVDAITMFIWTNCFTSDTSFNYYRLSFISFASFFFIWMNFIYLFYLTFVDRVISH